jgi:2EXR family
MGKSKAKNSPNITDDPNSASNPEFDLARDIALLCETFALLSLCDDAPKTVSPNHKRVDLLPATGYSANLLLLLQNKSYLASPLEDPGSTISLLQKELPDPDQELYFQHIPTPTFHGFPALPIELRLKIWHCTFPHSRRIIAFRSSDTVAMFQFPKDPIACFINRESYLEIMKHFQMCEVRAMQPTGYQCALFYLSRDPNKNSIKFEQSNASSMRYGPDPGTVPHKELGGESFFPLIGTLEVRIHDWIASSGLKQWLKTLESLTTLRFLDNTDCKYLSRKSLFYLEFMKFSSGYAISRNFLLAE